MLFNTYHNIKTCVAIHILYKIFYIISNVIQNIRADCAEEARKSEAIRSICYKRLFEGHLHFIAQAAV